MRLETRIAELLKNADEFDILHEISKQLKERALSLETKNPALSTFYTDVSNKLNKIIESLLR